MGQGQGANDRGPHTPKKERGEPWLRYPEKTMPPDFAGAFLRGLLAGMIGLLTEPAIIFLIVAAVGIQVWSRRRRQR